MDNFLQPGPNKSRITGRHENSERERVDQQSAYLTSVQVRTAFAGQIDWHG